MQLPCSSGSALPCELTGVGNLIYPDPLGFGCSFVAPVWVAPGTAVLPVCLQKQSGGWMPWYWSLWLASSPWVGLCVAVFACLASLTLHSPLLPLACIPSSTSPLSYLCPPTESQLAFHLSLQYVFDYQEGEVFGCVADIGWITGHSYVVYGPLCNGGTSVLFESTPVYPDPGEEMMG